MERPFTTIVRRSELAIAAPGHEPDLAEVLERATCSPKIDVGHRVVERALLEHQARAAALAGRRALLGGLEHEQHRAGQPVARARERLGDTEQDRGVRVVSARVHHADLATLIGRANARRERKTGLLGDRQRIHVGAQRHDRALRGAAQHRHHARVRHLRAHVEAELAQPLRDERGGAHLAIAELGVLVQIAPPRDHLRLHRARRAVDRVAQILVRRGRGGQRGERAGGGAEPNHALSRGDRAVRLAAPSAQGIVGDAASPPQR